MAKRINAASRLHEILARASQRSPKDQTVDVWAVALGLDRGNPREKANEVSESLSLMHRELQTLAERMRKTDLSSDQYEPEIDRIAHCMDPMALAAAWSGPNSYLTNRTLYALGLWSEILTDEEELINADELVKLLAEIEDLETTLNEAFIPEALRELIRHHVANIRDAISRYKIMGARALHEAANAAVADIVRHKHEFAKNSNSEHL